MEACPWSGAKLKKLGRHIRDGTPVDPGLPTYPDVMLWYNELAAEVMARIAATDWMPLLQDRPFEVASRPKTIDTLRQKLKRDRSTPLPNIQDVAGVRFEAEMSLDEQDAVVNAIVGMFGHDESCVRDMRPEAAAHSGYRAVHIWLKLEARVEVQVRTHLQSMWANMYESAADHYGRDIRYGALPNDESQRRVVLALQDISTKRIAQMERDRNERTTLQLAVEELALPADSEEHASIQSRLKRIRAREQSNERRTEKDLAQLKAFFESARTR